MLILIYYKYKVYISVYIYVNMSNIHTLFDCCIILGCDVDILFSVEFLTCGSSHIDVRFYSPISKLS